MAAFNDRALAGMESIDCERRPGSALDDEFYAEMVKAYVELYPAHAAEILRHVGEYMLENTRWRIHAGEYSDSDRLLAPRLQPHARNSG
ncbi:MAG TPA: hypothetical protein VI756_04035 [Blastocatellia bacterium]